MPGLNLWGFFLPLVEGKVFLAAGKYLAIKLLCVAKGVLSREKISKLVNSNIRASNSLLPKCLASGRLPRHAPEPGLAAASLVDVGDGSDLEAHRLQLLLPYHVSCQLS